jgi:hypothetical protein
MALGQGTNDVSRLAPGVYVLRGGGVVRRIVVCQ